MGSKDIGIINSVCGKDSIPLEFIVHFCLFEGILLLPRQTVELPPSWALGSVIVTPSSARYLE